jgi:hypothetical protein
MDVVEKHRAEVSKASINRSRCTYQEDSEMSAQDDLHPNEMCWRFWHEDEDCNRIVISKNRKFNAGGHDNARILLQEVIEDWAWNEPGEWDREGSNHDVLVIGPKNMAGRWNVRIFATPCVTAERSELDEPRGLSAAEKP